MSNSIDISIYPKVEEKVRIAGLNEKKDYIIWLKMNKSEAALALAELSYMCNASTSSNLLARRMAKHSAGYLKSTIGSKVHPFAAEQAKYELGIDKERFEELMLNLKQE